jgi:hypothetical protein
MSIAAAFSTALTTATWVNHNYRDYYYSLALAAVRASAALYSL